MEPSNPSNQPQPPLLTETGEAYEIPEDGSLGLLALGYAGLMLWRQKRAEAQKAMQSRNTGAAKP